MQETPAPAPVAPPRDESALAVARNRRRERTRTGLAAVVALLGILYALVLVVGKGGEDAASTAAAARIELLAAETSGTSPATGTPAPPPSSVLVTTLSGDSPGLYGARRVSRCNLDQVVGAGQGRLTEVVLLRDIRVTAVRGGLAPVQAVLQQGTDVLVDEFGVPRVRCAGVIPLTPARPVTAAPSYVGASWPGFDPGTLTVVVAATERVDGFLLTNLDAPGGAPIVRKPGERP